MDDSLVKYIIMKVGTLVNLHISLQDLYKLVQYCTSHKSLQIARLKSQV